MPMNVPAQTLENANQMTGKAVPPTIVEGLEEVERRAKRSAQRALREAPLRARSRRDAPVIPVDTLGWIDFLRCARSSRASCRRAPRGERSRPVRPADHGAPSQSVLTDLLVPLAPEFRNATHTGILLRMATRTQSRDTSVEIERRQVAAWRAMNASQKFAIVSQLTLAAEEMACAGIRERHPNATGREIELRLGALRLDRDTMIRVFGWDAEKQGY